MRIANIVTDEKFIDDVISLQDMLNGGFQHDYIILRQKRNYPEEFIYIKNHERVETVLRTDFFRTVRQKKYVAIFLHSLLAAPLHITAMIPDGIKVFWFSWGYDIYAPIGFNKPLVQIELYKEKTNEILNALKSKKNTVDLRSFVLGARRYIASVVNRIFLKRAVSRVDFYSGVLPYEYELMKEHKFFHAKEVEYHYYSYRKSSPDVPFVPCNATNIILGNSADPTNNHMDALEILMKLDLHGRKIIVPLSYGNMQYADFLCETISKKSWAGIVAVKDFMPFEDYAKLIGSCGVSIYFHERQQATVNIFLSLRNGNKVFLSETNRIYGYLKSLGFTVFSVQRDLNQASLDTPLTESEQLRNWQLYYKTHNMEIQRKCLGHIYDCI